MTETKITPSLLLLIVSLITSPCAVADSDRGAPGQTSSVELQQYLEQVRRDHALPGVLDAELVHHLHQPFGRYALGWFVESRGGEPRSWHGGSAGTFLASIEISHTRDVAVVFLTNTRTDAAATACASVVETLMRKPRPTH